VAARLPGNNDTIAAVATAPGRGGIGIVRLSGPDSRRIGEQLTGRVLTPRHAHFTRLTGPSAQSLDEGVVLYFPAPGSFTGEDVVELQCHGSPVQLQVILRECLALGARGAEPGEFSQRAFLNGKLDLVQAEAVADLIDSGSEAAARGALRSLSGEFSRRVSALLEQLIRLRVFVEAAIDFPEEEIDFIADSDVQQQLDALQDTLGDTIAAARRGRALRDGIKLVLAGAPNAGKSSLLNALSGEDSAIVTDTPGTTRDALREYITLDGLPLHIVDTAGLRDSGDVIEREGMRRAQREMDSADRILLVVDDNEAVNRAPAAELVGAFADALPKAVPVTVLRNKCDLSGRTPGLETDAGQHIQSIALSAANGTGLDVLRRHLLDCAGLADPAGVEFSARQRHINALEDTAEHIATARAQLSQHQSAELVAEDLRYAQESLASITGAYTSDDLLGAIFSSFCIGK
jgi:tRNA modification GTPase